MAQEEVKQEKSNNCAGCNKPFKKIKRYYRNGKFFCGKKCWQKSSAKKGAEKTNE